MENKIYDSLMPNEHTIYIYKNDPKSVKYADCMKYMREAQGYKVTYHFNGKFVAIITYSI